MPAPINDVDPQPAHCLAVASLLRLDPLSPPARDIDDPQRRVPTLIRDVGDMLAVVGPARGSGVEVTVGDRKGIAAFARHQPQLMPLAAEVGAVDDAPAVGGPVGTGLPRGFFVADLPRHRARPRRHPPESARSVDVAPVRDEEKLTAVRRPRRREIVVPPAVVIAGEPAVLVFGQAGDQPLAGSAMKMCQRRLYKDDTNARRPPSGDQRGSTFTAPFAVKARTVPAVRSSSSSSIASLA